MRSTEEIAAEIIKEIRNATPVVDETLIHGLIEDLRAPGIRDFQFGNRSQNKRYAEKVIKWIEDGHRLLAGRPGVFDVALLFHNEPIDPDLGELFVPEFASERARSLKDILAGIRRQAKSIVKNRIGAHGNCGQDQKLAAQVAQGLVAKHGLPAAYSSENSVYCAVARLCFETITGRRPMNADILRACRDVGQEFPAKELALLAKKGRSSPFAMGLTELHIIISKRREARKSGSIGLDLAFGRIGTEKDPEE